MANQGRLVVFLIGSRQQQEFYIPLIFSKGSISWGDDVGSSMDVTVPLASLEVDKTDEVFKVTDNASGAPPSLFRICFL